MTIQRLIDEVSATALARTAKNSKASLVELRGGNGQITLGTKKHANSDSHRIADMRTAQGGCDVHQSNLDTTLCTARCRGGGFGDGAGSDAGN
jgi:hypothetical protein